MQNQIIKITSDGSSTIYLPEMDEQYHSMNGAVTESNHVFIEKGYLFCTKKNPVVFEVGFGTGLNCLLTAYRAEMLKQPTIYFSVEKYPVSLSIARQLNYGPLVSEQACEWFEEIHSCEWEKMIRISKFFRLCKLNMDITENRLQLDTKCNVVYFDAFGPDKQPEMWAPGIFKQLSGIVAHGGVFVTYSAKGQVRRDLATAGFCMERLPGPPGKKEMLRGIKMDSSL